MELFLRRGTFVLMLLAAAVYYIETHYQLLDVLNYVERNRNSVLAVPMTNYYIGMAYYMREQYEPAARAFNQVLTNYATGYYTQDGLLRVGQCYEELRNWQGARETYQQYMSEYPDGKNFVVIQKRYDRIKFNQ